MTPLIYWRNEKPYGIGDSGKPTIDEECSAKTYIIIAQSATETQRSSVVLIFEE